MASTKSILPEPDNVRLVTIVAHVDHGKTTLADNLVESNGIISERLAGTLRYLDFMEEEQRRGITMRTSAIGLKHLYNDNPKNDSNRDMVIHLMDSPGHVDFSMEVTSSLQCCDGAILVVDAVEGMCARTQSILREAYTHQLVPVLVINKMDRLCTELCLSETEAFLRVRNLIESVNAAAAAIINNNTENHYHHGDDAENVWEFDPQKGNVVFASALYGWGFTIPSLARSLFRTGTIKNFKPLALKQYLFRDCYYVPQTGKIMKWKQSSDNIPMFAQYALRPIWDIYQHIATIVSSSLDVQSDLFADNRIVTNNESNHANKKQPSKKKNKGIQTTTPGIDVVLDILQEGFTTSSKQQRPKTVDDIVQILQKTGASSDVTMILSVLLRRYRPLSHAVLDAVCDHCPSPSQASSSIRTLALSLQTPPSTTSNDILNDYATISNAIRNCSKDANAPSVAHICKFMSTLKSHVHDPSLSSASTVNEDENNDTIIMGLARVLSGTLVSDDVEYSCFGPRYIMSESNQIKKRVRLYLLMGSSFVQVSTVPAGHICAIFGLEDLQFKTVTLCDNPNGMPLKQLDTGIRPLVKVNVEAVSASDTEALERGLVKLSLADAAVEVTATSKGERILACLGEIHLEQSIFDLENTYCSTKGNKKIQMRISDPIVEFGESTTWFETNETTDYHQFWDDTSSAPVLRQTLIPPYCYEEGLEHAKRGRSRAIASKRGASLHVRVIPLFRNVYECLQTGKITENTDKDALLEVGQALHCSSSDDITPDEVLKELKSALCALDSNGNALIESAGVRSGQCIIGVCSDSGEVFMPADELPKDNDGENQQEPYQNHDEDDQNESKFSGYEEYVEIKSRIRNSGLGQEFFIPNEGQEEVSKGKDSFAFEYWKSHMHGSAVAGFQMAMRSGPLCEEPVRGVMVILEGVEIALQKKKTNKFDNNYETASQITGGMVVSALRSGIRTALLTRPVRLLEGHLRLTLHSNLSGLGPLYTVLSRRRGKVVSDNMVDGTDLLMIAATIPQVESFGLAPELLKKSSGEVTAPELVFSHWEMLDQDPFWIPTSLEEREDFGEIVVNGDSSTGIDNNALKYIRMVRGRKGLLVDSHKIVVAAEKQRTLSRKK